MPVDIAKLIDSVEPENTVLFFGAGSSIPSGAPLASDLANHLATTFKLPPNTYSLAEIASLIEQNNGRRDLIVTIRERIGKLVPTGGILNLPLYRWRSLFTTNYDDLIEKCYERAGKDLSVYASDFDFTLRDNPVATKLFKLHGSIGMDVSDGHSARLIITDTDYDYTGSFRQSLYDRLKGDMVGGHIVVIGHSLQDPDIREIVNRAAEMTTKVQGAWKVSLLLYQEDENRALLFERRGFKVCFGGIDTFFAELARKLPGGGTRDELPDSLSAFPTLRPTTIDVEHASRASADVSAMFNGWPATHADILAQLTFERSVAKEIDQYLADENTLCAVLLGASGLGKTTAARQAIQYLRQRGYLSWEHKRDFTLNVRDWVRVAFHLHSHGKTGVLMVDEAHSHLQQINDVLDELASKDVFALKFIFVSTRNHWGPRIKSPSMFRLGTEFRLGKLQHQEIERLLVLVETNSAVRALVEHTFSGFSRYEKRRRLVDRCESETFVCLRNIFASEKFDDIILREYAALHPMYQDIYRHVAAMETAGIRVHRQLVIRLLGIPAQDIAAALTHLSDIVHEYSIDEREGLYGWRGRHSVIAAIIAKYKFPDVSKLAELFSRVIDSISPTYEIEIRTIREMCNVESGLPSIPDKSVQNRLLRKMMSVVPGERVPRHRLIRNLIEMGELEKAETEIRIFDKDFGRDGPVARYKVALLTARATRTPGIMEEDRLAILEQARDLAATSTRRYPNNKALLAAYCDVGLEIYRRTKDFKVYDAAMAELKAAEERLGDPDVTRLVARYAARIQGVPVEDADTGDELAS